MIEIADSAFEAMALVIEQNKPVSQLFPEEKQPGESFAIHQVDSVMMDKQAYIKLMGTH
jgi:hypothetical protein